jgi:tRNA1Val (adenine37-N6)-methyltransferase
MLKGTVEFLRLNVTDARSSLNQRYFNMVVSNPPYYKMSTGRVSPYRHREQARRETDATFADFARAAHWALVHKGRFYFVHTPSRLVEIFVTLRALNLEPKQLLLLCPHEKRAAEIMIVEAIKDAKSGIIVHAPRILLN